MATNEQRQEVEAGRDVIPLPPQGYRRFYAGLSRPGDLQYCHEHGWEPCVDFGVSVRGFNALAAPEGEDRDA